MQPLHLDDYRRYGRQMILDGFGLSGVSLFLLVFRNADCLSKAQLKLQRSSVVVVGAGGLGCPALQYLAATGVGAWITTTRDSCAENSFPRPDRHYRPRCCRGVKFAKTNTSQGTF